MKMVCFATSLFYPSSSPHCPPTSSVSFRLQTVQDPCFPCSLLQPLSRCGENSFALMCIKSHLLLMCTADSFLLFIPQHLRLNLHDSAMTGTRQLLSFKAFICTQFTLAQVKVFSSIHLSKKGLPVSLTTAINVRFYIPTTHILYHYFLAYKFWEHYHDTISKIFSQHLTQSSHFAVFGLTVEHD